MRKIRSSVAPILVLVLLVAAVACAGASPQRVALNTLQATRQSVVTAVGVFNTGYQAGQFNDAQRDQLGVAYNKYLAADTAAALALKAATDTQAQAIVADVLAASVQVLQFVQSLKAPTPVPVKTP